MPTNVLEAHFVANPFGPETFVSLVPVALVVGSVFMGCASFVFGAMGTIFIDGFPAASAVTGAAAVA
jgi:hypothetical protein